MRSRNQLPALVVSAIALFSLSFASSVFASLPCPPTPTITAGSTSACPESPLTLTADSAGATGFQWFKDLAPLSGETSATLIVDSAGSYTVQASEGLCAPSTSLPYVVSNPSGQPVITPQGPTTFCAGGHVLLSSNHESGQQWYLDGAPIPTGTFYQYDASLGGSYTVTSFSASCTSVPSAPVVVTVTAQPATPTITPGGPTTFCAGGSVTLDSGVAAGNQWYLDGNPIGGATNEAYIATASGSYTVIVTSGCDSAPSAATVVTVNAVPTAPTVSTNAPTTFCDGGSVTLDSGVASGNQWYLNGSPIGGATSQTYGATVSGDYSVTVSANGCTSGESSPLTVTVNPSPATPTITPGGPTAFCIGGSVTLTSSTASGNQWYVDGNPIGGETNQTYLASSSGLYTVVVTANGCDSLASAATTVTATAVPPTPAINPLGATTFCAGGSVQLDSGVAAGNQWYLNGNPIGGAINQIYLATAAGSYTVVITNNSCSGTASAPVVVTVNPAPPVPTINAVGPTLFCAGGSVQLNSSSATGNQWYLFGVPIGGATNQSFVANALGSYTVSVTSGGCSTSSAPTIVTVIALPPTPTVTPGGPTTFCAGGSVTLTASTISTWYLNGNLINLPFSDTYIATASGSYTAVAFGLCNSAPSVPIVVTVNPTPATPTITPGGPTTFCTGGSVTLTSSSATGNQWSLNGNPIGGATNQTYIATAAGGYTVVVTASGCSSVSSATTTVTVNANPNATITTAATAGSGSTGNVASVANAGAGATYAWSITNGSITGGSGTAGITFTAGGAGTLTLQVTVTTASGCSDTKSANVTVSVAVSISSVVPATGTPAGGTNITINGNGFASGATVTIGGSAATNVVVVNGTTITAKTPAHAAGLVNVVVTNTNATTATKTNGYLYAIAFDPNGDGKIDPADIFYLVNYLFTNGPAPAGPGGTLSGDANGDGAVDPADIFFLVNYLFTGGPQPLRLEISK
jgi:hypothetical protein